MIAPASPAPPATPQGSSLGDQGAGPPAALNGAPSGGWGGVTGGPGNQGQNGTISAETDDPNKGLNDPRWQGGHGAEGPAAWQAKQPSAFASEQFPGDGLTNPLSL